MTEDFSADLEHEHRLIDAGIESYLNTEEVPLEQRRNDLGRALRLLRRHIYFEEDHLFPLLRAAGLAGPISVMTREHRQMWFVIDRLLVEDTPATTALCRDLLGRLATHNWKEEGVVYAKARELLPEADRVVLSGYLSQTEVPEGWASEGFGVAF